MVIACLYYHLTFFLMRIAPENLICHEKALPANIQAQLNKQYGLSKPMVYPVQGLPSGHSQVQLRLFHEVPGAVWPTISSF